MFLKLISILLISLEIIHICVSEKKCLQNCKCSGKLYVECIGSGFHAIPKGINPSVNVLNLNGNDLQILPTNAFQSTGLIHLKQLFLSRCNLKHIDDNAFVQNPDLTEIDLSNNSLPEVPSRALNECPILKKLRLSNNPLIEIQNNTFKGFNYLQTLDLSYAKIETIDVSSFEGLFSLKSLQLNGNKLINLSPFTLYPLISLMDLYLHNNPWKCDCNMRPLRDWIKNDTTEVNEAQLNRVHCASPERLKGHSVAMIDRYEFACMPIMISFNLSSDVHNGDNPYLSCVISADPSPEIQWYRHNKLIKNMSLMSFGRQLYRVKELRITETKINSTLIIHNVFDKDSGDYKCVGHNKVGNVSKLLKLTVKHLHRNKSNERKTLMFALFEVLTLLLRIL